MKKKYTALVMQGGGALGAFEYGVCKYLYEEEKISPDVISGVSIGAISAAILTGAKDGPIEGLGKLWEMLTAPDIPFISQQVQLMLSLPYNAGMYSPNMNLYFNPTSATSLSDTAPLYKTLDTLIDKKKLNKGTPRLTITSTNIETGMIENFDNREAEITFGHIAASGSLPPSFPMTKIKENHYWDGGLYSNTPLAPALNHLEELGDKDSEREIILVELYPQKGSVPKDMTDVCARMTQINFACKVKFDQKLYEKFNGFIDLMQEIDQELPKTSKIRQNPSFKRLLKYKKIHKITIIRPTSPEALMGAADFTEKSVKRRIKEGYEAAKVQYMH